MQCRNAMNKDPLEKLKFMQQSAEHESRQQKQRVIAAMQDRGLGSACDACRADCGPPGRSDRPGGDG